MECVMLWCLIIEEFDPKLTYFQGEQNIVAHTLSRMYLAEEEFSADDFAGEPQVRLGRNLPVAR